MISDAGLSLIKQFEGCRLEAYPDPASGGDPWTIGYGHTKGVRQGQTCTQEQADAWLVEDAQEASLQVLRAVKVRLTQEQLDALTSFVFNLGIGNFEKSTLLRKLSVGDFEGAANEFPKWNKAAGKVMPGLVRRRAAERSLFMTNMEKPVLPLLPIISAVLPSLVQAAPSLIRIFGDSPQAEKNAKAAEIVANIAKESTGETTTEGAANAIATDPEKAAAFREAVHVSMNDLLATLQAVNDIEQKSLAASRQFNAGEPMMVELSWLKLKFIHILSFVFVAYAGTFAMLKWDSLTAELKGAVITLMIIAGWNGVRDYWMSSSAGSAEKTRELVKSREG